jgi:hypothetical protein
LLRRLWLLLRLRLLLLLLLLLNNRRALQLLLLLLNKRRALWRFVDNIGVRVPLGLFVQQHPGLSHCNQCRAEFRNGGFAREPPALDRAVAILRSRHNGNPPPISPAAPETAYQQIRSTHGEFISLKWKGRKPQGRGSIPRRDGISAEAILAVTVLGGQSVAA